MPNCLEGLRTILMAKLNWAYDSWFPCVTRKTEIYKIKAKPWLSSSLLKACKNKNSI